MDADNFFRRLDIIGVVAEIHEGLAIADYCSGGGASIKAMASFSVCVSLTTSCDSRLRQCGHNPRNPGLIVVLYPSSVWGVLTA